MQTINPVNTVAIVGGGTSAWLTAAMLSNAIPHLEIIIIDKEVGTPVGVGEGTLLSFDSVMKKCGFEIEDWFFELDATYKSGILFPGWGKDQEAVWHPFLFAEFEKFNTTVLDSWSKNQSYDFKEYGLSLYDVSVNHNKVDRRVPTAYAFHIDAGKLVKYIQKKLEARFQVTSIKSEVVDIQRDTKNYISHLTLKNGKTVAADLFIDCTGFKGLLNFEPDRVTLEGRLFCDTAIAAHVPYADREKELHPYVISEQVEHGWVWNIPVQSRIGSGLVFNRSQTSIEDAKEFFCNYWDNRITKENLKVIDWTPYYNKNIWHENVVAIGLSAGFIEPLESTGIALIIAGIEQLTFALEARFYCDHHIQYYNLLMNNFFEDSIDFVSMHYSKSTRKESFWKWVSDTYTKSPRQIFYENEIQQTDRKLPVKGTGYMFCASNWVCWLIQMGYPIAPANDMIPATISSDLILKHRNDVESRRYETSPGHIEFIEQLKKHVDNKKNN
jgi:tryptophan halogenase